MYMHDNIRCVIKSLELTGSILCISFLHIIHSVQLDHYLVLSFYGGSAFLPLNETRGPYDLWTWCACNEQRSSSKATDGEPANSESDPAPEKASSNEGSSISNSNLVFGYLNLFSDGVVSLSPETCFVFHACSCMCARFSELLASLDFDGNSCEWCSITSLMGWLLGVPFCYMVLLVAGPGHYFCLHMNFPKRLWSPLD